MTARGAASHLRVCDSELEPRCGCAGAITVTCLRFDGATWHETHLAIILLVLVAPSSDTGSSAPPDAPLQLTPPESTEAPLTAGPANTPRKAKVGPTNLDRTNTSEARKENVPGTRLTWCKMLLQNFAGEFPIDDFLENYVPKPDSEGPETIDNIVSQAYHKLTDAAEQLKSATSENAVSKPLRDYLETLVSSFPAENKPLFEDTCHKTFPSLDKGDHYTKPDITGTRPGIKKAPTEWRWSHAGVVIELKWKIDIINAQGELDQAEGRRHAAVQLAKSARSLLMATGSCHVYVVAVFNIDIVRIFRFDRTGFRASAPFDWLKAPNIFPTFFYRLYNPGTAGRMAGEDDTITTPTVNEKTEMYNAMCKNPFYKDLYPSQEEATDESLWIKAVRFEPGTRVPQVVSCFTIGPVLSQTDGLFSRATRVFRVILQEDADTDSPIVYALKDAWRECRRPEIDYYDVIAKYCANEADNVDAVVSAAMKSMAKCRGSVDLSIVGREPAIPGHNPLLHKTSSATNDNFERCHMRTLITPVGAPLREFKSTKALVQALNSAVLHHRIAYDAGVLHRDVSEGNVLFEEAVAVQKQGFLIDWDYAEFTAAGLTNFKAWFPERQAENNMYVNIDKSLKDMTGTLPFMAIAIIKNTTTHDAHHDLESFYWLLIWMILRHTRHTDPNGRLGCSSVFDPPGTVTKLGWIQGATPIAESALFTLAEQLRAGTIDQNPTKRITKRRPPGNNAAATARTTTNAVDPLTYEFVLYSFLEAIESEDWPTPDDPALKFVVPSLEDLLKETLEKQTHRASGSGIKRRRQPEDDPLPVASVSIGGTTAAASSGESKSKKTRKTEAPQPAETGEGMRRSQRNKGKAGSA
ncbi:hypothetical protein B0H11DRAFT_555038 [Mycena galericulata]|nr:hypothetical protein B0H11DRAFT_555038 [Mycena galericulata]